MTPDSETPDGDLLLATARGDERAFEQFFGRHGAALLAYARALTRDADRAEDVTQQTLMDAWKGAGAAVVAGGARPWLFAIARHTWLRLRRRPVAAPEPELSLDELGAAAGFAAPDATPERFAAAAEEREILASAVARLPDHEREILHLRDIEQMPGEEVARLLDLGLAAMKSRLHRARLHLVAEIRRLLPEDN